VSTAVTAWLALILAASGALKARRPRDAAAALATYGIRGPAAQVTAGALIVAELALAAALAVGATWAAAAATVLFAAFTAITAAALAAGRGGRPCACFGGGSRLGWAAPLRSGVLTLAAGALALELLPTPPTSYDEALTAALALALAAVAGLALALLALAREVGVLRLSAGRGALEIPHEGPPLGSAQAWAVASAAPARAMLRLAIFSSNGCPLCTAVAPAVEHVARDPLLAVALLDEERDRDQWLAAEVPGSPYAVALTLDGVVLAKGAFNGLAQLESVVGTARLREREPALAA